MAPTNKEMQQNKNCRLYAYLLTSQGKEVPEAVQECADSYEDVFDCVKMLAKEVESLDSETFDRVVNDTASQEARDLAYWWQMYQEAQRVHRSIFSGSDASE